MRSVGPGECCPNCGSEQIKPLPAGYSCRECRSFLQCLAPSVEAIYAAAAELRKQRGPEWSKDLSQEQDQRDEADEGEHGWFDDET